MNQYNQIVIGRTLEEDGQSLGFGLHAGTKMAGALVHDLKTPIMTIAPTGAGKGVSCIIPVLLTLDTPVVVIDPKGEAFQVTAAQRRRMGHQVICIDPFSYAQEHNERGALNPFDLIDPRSPSAIDDATSLAAAIAPAVRQHSDVFWETKAQQIIAGFILAVIAFAPKRHRHLGTLRKMMCAAPAELAAVLRAMIASDQFDQRMSDTAKQLMSMPDKTCASVMATVTSMLDIFGGSQIRSAIDRTTFGLDDLQAGRDLSIYIVMPPDKLVSHSALLRMWIATLVRVMFRRRSAPAKPCLIVVDEAAQLGALDEFRTLVTFGRGYGIVPWLFFQSLSQLQLLYADWRTFVENCGTLQVFGFNSQLNVEQALALTGYAGQVPLLGADRRVQLIAQTGRKPSGAHLLNYLNDPGLRQLAGINTLATLNTRKERDHERE